MQTTRSAPFPSSTARRSWLGPRPLWIPFIKQRYDIEFKVLAQNFGIGLFLNDPAFIQEGFYIAEPFFIEQKGAKVKLLTLAEGGWHAYAHTVCE